MDVMSTFSFSYPNGEPQTPTRTPTSSGPFGDASFQTPKFESSFYDPRVTWDTADPYASSPELLKTPQKFVFGNGTPGNSLQAWDGSFGQHISPNIAAKGPVDTDTIKRKRSSRPAINFGEEGPSSVNSTRSAATIQTPPPTSTSRRKAGDPGDAGQGFMDSVRKLAEAADNHLETPSRMIGASPHLFANLENSPDLFRFSTTDPSSASPFFPQQKLFLDQDGNDLATLSNQLFNVSTAAPNAASQSQSLEVPPLPTMQGSLDLSEFSHDNSFAFGAPATADAALFPAPFSTSPRVLIPKADDPSLFLSSPARRFGPSQPVPEPRTAPRPTRQPYHHQTEEAKREQLRRASQVHSRPLSGSWSVDDEDDDFTPRAQAFKPGLTRSQTTTAIPSSLAHSRQQSQQSFAGSLASASGATGVKKLPPRGRISPVKAMRQPLPRSNSSSLPSRSQSLVLKIDKDGRAKTEFQATGNQFTGLTDPILEMDIDGSATESETDSADFSDYPAVHSGRNSFAFQGRPASFVGRTGSISRPNSKSSHASSHSGRRSPWADSRSKRPQSAIIPSEWANTPRRFSIPANPNFTRHSSSTDSTLPDPDEDSGDAQHALRQVLQGRGRHTVGRYSGGRMPISQSMNHLPSSPPGLGRFDLGSGDPPTSPTTITDPDLGTPSTDRRSNPSSGTRCVCKSMENGGHLMIQW